MAIGLSFDSFAVSVSIGVIKKEIEFSKAVTVALSLAFFQALFPLAGWIIGKSIHELLKSIDHWIALFLLFFIGARMIYEGARNMETIKAFSNLSWNVVLAISIATSIDALAVGLSFGFLQVNMIYPVFIIGGVTFIAAMLGMLFGKYIPARKSNQSVITGGIILILIGLKILIEHTVP